MIFAGASTPTPSIPLFSESASIFPDPMMGRCLIAKQNFCAGQIMFQESAFIYSTYDGRNPHDQELIKSSFPRVVVDRLDEILDDLSNLGRVQSLDTAKNFILLLAMQRLRNIGKTETILKYFRQQGTTIDDLQEKLSRFDALTAANFQDCVSDIRSIRSDYPKLISQDVTTEQAAHLLGVVSTNQLELEELGGSALFVNTAIMQHDCSPNCSYTTNGTTLYMAAIQDIAIGQRLSIDYGNNFYRPTMERLETLFETYGFRCSCQTCADADKKRPFKCEYCKIGTFFPISSGNLCDAAGPPPSVCGQCARPPSAAHVAACDEREQTLSSQPPTSLAQYAACCTEGLLHDAHHIFFWALEDIYLKLSGEARSCYFDSSSSGAGTESNSVRLYTEALQALKQCVSMLEWQLPAVHHEKVVYYDRLGQLAVAVGDASLARDSYRAAYNQSVLSSGAAAPATLATQRLAANPPTSLAELLEHYSARSGGGAGAGDNEDGNGDWEDMDEES